MARWILEVLGFRVLSLVVEPEPEAENAEYEEETEVRLTTSDHSFGFAPDPMFKDYWWEEE